MLNPYEVRNETMDHGDELRTRFDELVELDEAGREARLREIGERDAALRARLEAMLAADSAAEQRLRAYDQAVARSIRAVARRVDTDPLGLVGTTVDDYRIDAVLGAGGMGVVYRATDLRLDRVAALKFLTPAWSLDALAKTRFLHEARAASALDHANICTIYEAGETASGALYIAMACYEGETLSARLERGPLDIDEAVELASQAARGLAAAHARGLVHRDIKPANLFVTADGTLKVLDFGVAKVTDGALTLPEQRPGTFAYMAPEQARGVPVDGRADVWSLGMVLYELLTGSRPTAATRPGGRVPPSSVRPGVPAAVDGLVLEMLEDEPAARPWAGDVVRLLADGAAESPAGARRRRRAAFPTSAAHGSRAVAYVGVGVLIAFVGVGSYVYLQDRSMPTAGVAAAAPRFVAVLPFANTSQQADNEFFADGVTDDIIAQLALVPDFSVVSRTTSMSYKQTAKTIPEIADELGVQYVLEGSARRFDDRVRITAQLVDARSDKPLWATTYDRELEDIFAVQTEIAGAIAAALEVQLSAGVAARIGRRPTRDLEAYDFFLLGRESLYRYDPEGISTAIRLFERALERDPAFALARSWLGRALAMWVHNQGLGSAWADSAVRISRRAIADQPDLSDGYVALGTAYWVAGRYEDGVIALRRARELNPNDEIATHNLGALTALRGDFDQAIRLTRRSLDLDPGRSSSTYANLIYYHALLGMFDEADAMLERALAIAPDAQGVLYSQAWFELLRGRTDAAVGAAVELARLGDENPGAAHEAAHLFTMTGELERARDAARAVYERSSSALRELLIGVLYGHALLRTGEDERGRQVLAHTELYARAQIEAGHEAAALRYSLAAIHAVRGEQDAAFQWLDEAIQFGWNTARITAADPLLENIRSDSRFQLALNRMDRSLAPMRERIEREDL